VESILVVGVGLVDGRVLVRCDTITIPDGVDYNKLAQQARQEYADLGFEPAATKKTAPQPAFDPGGPLLLRYRTLQPSAYPFFLNALDFRVRWLLRVTPHIDRNC
jgi:hypothetical protein